MGELASGSLQLLLFCAFVAFAAELALNRRPIFVATVVTLLAVSVLSVSAIAYLGLSDLGGAVEILSIATGLGFVASLIGSAAARGIRIATAKVRRQTTAHE